jgi:antitoxin component of RelBE/YafQ-DinJ toxin-antitoxin module
VKNITVSIDDETHRRARVYAAQNGTTLSALVKAHLNEVASRFDAGTTFIKPALDPNSEEFKRLVKLGQDARKRVGKGFSASERISRDEIHGERFSRKEK